MFRWIALVAVVAVIAVAITGNRGGPRVGGDAPEFAVDTLDGTTFTLGEMRGKVVVLDFWATYCGPCKVSLPALQRVKDQYASNPDVYVATVNTDRGTNRVPALKAWMKRRKLDDLPVLLDDARQTVSHTYQVKAIPTMVVIGRDGIVSSVQIGLPANTRAGIEAHITESIDKALSQPAS